MTMVQTFLSHDTCNLNELIKKMSFGYFWSSGISVLELGDRVEIHLVGPYLGVWITAACTVSIPEKNESSQ